MAEKASPSPSASSAELDLIDEKLRVNQPEASLTDNTTAGPAGDKEASAATFAVSSSYPASPKDPEQPLQSAPSAPSSAPPDGGLTAWMQVPGTFFCTWNSMGVTMIWGVFQAYYEQTLLSDHTSSEIAWIGAVQSCLIFVVGVFLGPIFDWGYMRSMIIVGTVMSTFGLMMTSLAKNYWQILLAQGFCTGIGAGCLLIPSLAVLPSYFVKRRAFAMGIAYTGNALSGICIPIAFRRLLNEVGFGWTVRILAFITLATCAIALACLRQRVKPPKARSLFHMQPWREPEYCLLCAAAFIGFLALWIPLFYLPLYALQKGLLDENLSFYLLAILNAGGFLGRLFFTFIADKAGPLNVLIFCFGTSAILAYGWLGLSSGGAGGIIVLSALYGSVQGPCGAIIPSILASWAPDLSTVGVRVGMLSSTLGLALLAGAPIAGAIQERSWSATAAFVGGMVTIATFLTLAAKVSRHGWKLKS